MDRLKVKFKYYFIIFIIFLVFLIFLLMKFYISPSQQTSYITTRARLGAIESTVLASGRLDAFERVNVGAQVSGQVKILHVHAGEHVRKGQLVAEIDDVPQRNELRNAESALDVIKYELEAKKSELSQSERNLKRNEVLYKKDLVSLDLFESFKTKSAILRAEFQSLKSRYIQATIEVEKRIVDLSYTRVTAPMDGVVIAVITQQGQTVNSSQSAPVIIKLARLDVMTVKVQVSEADITKVKVGQNAYFTIFSEPERRYIAKLRSLDLAPESVLKDDTLVSGSVAGSSGTSNESVYYNALLDVPNLDNKLRIAMSAQVTLISDKASNAILIPTQAVHKINKSEIYVNVLKKDLIEKRRVSLGLSNEVESQVLEGLALGDMVIISGSTEGKKQVRFSL
ncbi:efflux RND transporter periplasmic adaptor subunit [Pantoea agglomerans]|uniref:efflux RND transporter periplasmic adaptor subunit n=1 Tax=Enterobacter agglomerans TaxID=549 RepID=UPI001F0D3D08|nr:efflux RND transporter periplasmic adaptor subunit [Pantoea agglomerans]